MSHPLLNAFWIMLWFFLWVIWLMLLFRVVADVFGDGELSGWAKAGWLVFVCLLPYIGVFTYLIVRGPGMGVRAVVKAEESREAFDEYVREAAGSPGQSHADQLAKITDLRSSGALTEEEFQQAKKKILA